MITVIFFWLNVVCMIANTYFAIYGTKPAASGLIAVLNFAGALAMASLWYKTA